MRRRSISIKLSNFSDSELIRRKRDVDFTALRNTYSIINGYRMFRIRTPEITEQEPEIKLIRRKSEY